MEKPNKENTLYLPIKQTYFDQIVAGTKREEYREVKEGVTAGRYLIKQGASYVLNPESAEEGRTYYIDEYNGGKFPFLPRPYKYLNLAVGYAKERDTALVEVVDVTFEAENILLDRNGNPFSCFWIIVYHLGKVVEVKRKR